MLDISTKPTPMCLPSYPPSNKPHSTILTPLSAEFIYLCKLFILQWTHTTGSVDQLKDRLRTQNKVPVTSVIMVIHIKNFVQTKMNEDDETIFAVNAVNLEEKQR